ncbi:MAG: glycosyltransferase family 4 protein [Candidatus Binatia bacterium]
MNILLLCHEYPPLGGGGGIGANQYAEAWSQSGHKVTVLTSWRPGLKFKETLNGARVVRVFTIPRRDRARFSFSGMLSYIGFGLVHILSRRSDYRQNDVINIHFSLPGGVLGILAGRMLGIPCILTIIGGDIYDPTKRSSPHRSVLMRMVNSLVMNSADKLIAISSDTKRNAQRYYNVRNEITVINYGFPFTMWRSEGLPEIKKEDGKYHLVAIGRLVERKGFQYLIKALASLPENVVLSLIGDGPLEADLSKLAAECNLNGRLRMTGYVPRRKIYSYLQSADCFVLSSLHEGLGIVIQEAMYAGLPIVSTDNGGQVDIIENYRNGILVKPRESEPLAVAIKEIYENTELAETMKRNNRADIKRHYMTANAQTYIELFETTLRDTVSLSPKRRIESEVR